MTTVLEVLTAHKVLKEYNKHIGKSLIPYRLDLPIIGGIFDVVESNVWMIEVGMGFTRKQLIDACIFLEAFDLLENVGFENSKYGKVHRYKITKFGINIASTPNGLEGLILDNGNVILTKLIDIVTPKQTTNSISNTFVNSTVNQLQQAQETSKTNLSQTNEIDNSTNTKNGLGFELTKKEHTYKDILNQWWWTFVIPIIVGVIILAIENHWFSKG